MVKSLKEGSMEDRDDAAVDISPAVLRKGKTEFALLRAPLDAPFYQMDEDIKALLLSPTAAPGVTGIGVAVWSPAS
jgi:hypothetical protein